MANIPETLLNTLEDLLDENLKLFQWHLSNGVESFAHIPKSLLEKADRQDTVDKIVQKYGPDRAVKITLIILEKINQNQLAEDLSNTLKNGGLKCEEVGSNAAASSAELAPACHQKLKSKLRDKCQRINEGISGHGTSALLNEIYTELYITEGGSGEINEEHEVKQIETASRKRTTQETPIKCNDIFKPLPGEKKTIRTVLTKGVAGIGKTVSVQKFVLDWAEGKVNQDVLFMFPLPFRELNSLKEKKLSLMNLLHRFFPETKELKPEHYESYKVMFILDGLDECRLPLDYQNGVVDIEEQTSVDVLLTNLIKGTLLPSALLWITSRPAAVGQIPPECVDQVTEVRGFSDLQKQEYFRKRISDQCVANKIISHIRASRSLFIMCHIPVFCWISATVLKRMCEAKSGEIPKTLTQMFTRFLIFQIKHRNQKYSGKPEPDSNQTRESVLALGKLAFQQLEKGNLIFYEEDLRESGIDVREVSVLSGVCTQIFREEPGLELGKVFSFVHLSVQEFLAALYAFLCFVSKKDLNQQTTKQKAMKQQTNELSKLFSKSSMDDFLNGAVDQALQNQNGHLDLFLRFLLGLSLQSNQTLLGPILTHTGRISHSNEETVRYIKEKIQGNTSPERSINLFHCLNELNDHSLVNTTQKYLRKRVYRRVNPAIFSYANWSALVFVLLNSEEDLAEFDLSKYYPSEKCLLMLLPVVKASTKALLSACNLGVKTCETLGSVLKLENSSLKDLDLSNNDLQDSGVEMLSEGLKSSHCRLETLRLSGCNLGVKTCETLGSVLKLEKSSLKDLDLSNNDLQDLGVELFSAGLKSSHCTLEILRLSGCNLGVKTCETLGSVLKLENSSLKDLDLSNNDLQDSGVELLSEELKSSHCKLETLRLSGCMITEKGCSSLDSALSSNPSHLKELDLTYNHPGESGEKLLSARLEDPHCSLSALRMEHGGKIRIKPGPKKYEDAVDLGEVFINGCEFTLDPNTAHTLLSLSEENRKVVCVKEKQPYPDHPDRFDGWAQVLCRERVSGRCYWEAEWSGWCVSVSLIYKAIRRKGSDYGARIGNSDDGGDCGWTVFCSNEGYKFYLDHQGNEIDFPSSGSNRVGVYVDCPAGTLSFYSVSSDTHTLTHLHTFRTKFTEPLCAGFWLNDNSSVCLR